MVRRLEKAQMLKSIGLILSFIVALIVVIYAINVVSSRMTNPVHSFMIAVFGMIMLGLIGALIANIGRTHVF